MATKKKQQTADNAVNETVTEPEKKETALAKVEETPVATISEAESLEIRNKIKELKAQIDSNYFDLAGFLYQAYDQDLYRQWGFDTFKDYIENEVGFGARKAQYLIGIWDHFVNEVGDPSVIEKVKPLGWTKVKELKDVVNASNVDEWVKKAGEMNAMTLAEAARAALKTDFDDSGVDGTNGGSSPDGVDVAKTISFKLFKEQFDNVNSALERSAELTNSTKKGHLLDTICTDYLAQNAFTSGGKAAIGEFFAKFEGQLGVRIFAFDPDKKQCVYGEDESVRIVIVDKSQQEILCGEDVLAELITDVEETEEAGDAATA